MLEFNSPAHGSWNIVHTGMLLPESRQIYVCAQNCMRGVVLTAAEMGAVDRFSFVILEEKDMFENNLEDATIEGVTDVLNRLETLPKAVLLFTVCVHHFLGCDLKKVYRELGSQFPEVEFIRCFMDPIMKKHLTADQKLRRSIYDSIKKQHPKGRIITLLGSDFCLDESSDLKRILSLNDYKLRELPACKTWSDYQNLGEAVMFLCCYPSGRYGAEIQAERLCRPLLYLSASFSYQEITEELHRLAVSLNLFETTAADGTITQIGGLDIQRETESCEKEILAVKERIKDTPIVIDYTIHPRPLGVAKLLLEHGFNVKKVYIDSVSQEETEAKKWLDSNAPDLLFEPTINVKMRYVSRKNEEKILALGQKAAWFTGSDFFVNMVQGGGLWGFDGIRNFMRLMAEAFTEKKDARSLIVQKGWGCKSCI